MSSADQVAAVLAAATEDLIVATDAEGVVTVFNAGAQRMLGYTAEEVVGNMTPLVWHDHEEVRRRAAELGISAGFDVFVSAAERGEAETREWTLVRKDGTRLAGELTVTAVRRADHTISGYLGIGHDVTSQRKVEEALRQAESRYRMLVEHVPAITYLASLDDVATTLYVSPQVERLLGIPVDEWIASPESWLRRIHPDDRDEVLAQLEQCRLSGEPFVSEYRLLDRNGRAVWFHDEAAAIPPTDGNPGFLQGVMLDITERKRAEEAVRAAEAKYRGIVENAVEGIYQTTPSGRVLTANRALAHLLGYASPDELVNTVSDAAKQVYVDPEDRSTLLRELTDYRTVEGFECRVRRKDGRTIWILQNVRAVCDEHGNLLYLEGTVEDITARKEADFEHARLEQERDQFFSSISHDLRTPLAAITASIGVVLGNEPPNTPPALHRLLINIDQSADDMARMVEDLLELTRLQAGRVELRRQAIDLRQAVLRAVQEVEPLALARGQQIQVEVPPEPLEGIIDMDRVGRVLVNLLSNANKYGRDNGSITIRLQEHPREAVFSVTDDGPGICTEEQTRIFERFYRATSAVSSSVKGSGLGLPIARALVHLHGGRMWVRSNPGQGATFYVALPLDHARRIAGDTP